MSHGLLSNGAVTDSHDPPPTIETTGVALRRSALHDGSFALIVSPNLDIQDVYVLTLRAQRMRALGVDNHGAAMTVIGCTHVSAVLYDVERLRDWESLAAFRREVEPHIPIVVVSSCVAADRSYRQLARRMGCAAFIAKPCSPSTVVKAMQHAANGGGWTEYEKPGVNHPERNI